MDITRDHYIKGNKPGSERQTPPTSYSLSCMEHRLRSMWCVWYVSVYVVCLPLCGVCVCVCLYRGLWWGGSGESVDGLPVIESKLSWGCGRVLAWYAFGFNPKPCVSKTYTYRPSTEEVEAGGCEEFVVLGNMVSFKPVWATWVRPYLKSK